MLPDYDDPNVWLSFAQKDARAAKAILEADGTLTEPVGFHIQQAIEKTLKAYIIGQGQKAPHTHNIEQLLDECGDEPILNDLRDVLVPTTFFAVAIRYPGEPPPDLAKIESAMQAMDKLLTWARGRLNAGS